MHFGLEGIVPNLFYSVAILAFFASIFWRPHVGLFLLIPLLPLQSLRYRLHGYPLGGLFVDFIMLAVLIGLKVKGYPILPKTPFNRILATFVVFTYLSLWRGAWFIGSEWPLWFDDRRLQDWKNYVIMFLLLYLTASAVRTVRHMQILVVLMCLGVVMLDKYYLGTMTQRDFSQFSYDIRYAGAMGYAGVNGFAAFEAQFSAFLLAMSITVQRFSAKVSSLVLLGLNIACLLYALSRGGYAAFLVGWLYIGVIKKRSLLVLLIAFLTCWQAIVPTAVKERIFMTTNEDGTIDHSAGSRLNLWEEAFTVFEGDPVFGTGFNTYAYRSNFEGYKDTHNLYVKILVETGAFGLCLFLVLLWKMYHAGYKLFRTAVDPFLRSLGFSYAALIVAAAVANVFGDRWTYLQVSGYTWCLLGLVIRGQQITDEQAEASEAGELATGDVLQEVPA
jgi:putative inorganic carbon (hco3(-)) transporter